MSLCAAISDEEKEVVFTDFVNDAMSSLEADHVATWRANTAVAGQRIARTRTLGAILHDLDALRAFDLLWIEVEGHDATVLPSIDLDVYQPQVIVVEMRGFDSSAPRDHDICRCLTARRYRLVGFLVLNGYFVRSGDPSVRQPDSLGSA